VESIADRIAQLENSDFEDEGYAKRKQLAESDCDALVENGLDSFSNVEAVIDWIVGPRTMILEDPYDQYNYREQARIILISINAKVVPVLPWEAWFIDVGNMPGVPVISQVPQTLFQPHLCVR
jgi:hypothetical protein